MKSSKITRYASIGLLGLYVLYALSAIGMTGLLFSAAVGLLAYGLLESLEITAIITILVGVLYKVSMRRTEFFQPTNAQEVRKRVEKMKINNPSGVLASSYAEGFADVTSPTATDATATATATPATLALSPTPEDVNKPAIPKPTSSASVPAPAIPPEMFKNPADGLFKLGEIPTDEAGGFHIDQGTTVLNALNSLKPDQIKGMSEDTQKLIETQKSLMGMLGTMKPMLQDGKQLLETFNTMFKE